MLALGRLQRGRPRHEREYAAKYSRDIVRARRLAGLVVGAIDLRIELIGKVEGAPSVQRL